MKISEYGNRADKTRVETCRLLNIVTVRWWDGYKEDFRATEIRFGSYSRL